MTNQEKQQKLDELTGMNKAAGILLKLAHSTLSPDQRSLHLAEAAGYIISYVDTQIKEMELENDK